MSLGARLRALAAPWRRLAALGAVVSRHAAAAGIAARVERPGLGGCVARALAGRRAVETIDEPRRLRRIVEELGGSFLKLGQMLAMQPDLLPPAYTRELLELLDRVPAEPYDAIERVVTEELGAPPDALFDHFEPIPFASASIGQVHRARLDGVELAVKIQRPGAETDFHADLQVMRLAASAIRHLGRRRWRWIADHLDEMAGWIHRELDYRVEAGYGQAFERCFRGSPGQRVPRVVTSHSSRRVLAMEWLDAPTVSATWRGDRDVSEVDRQRFARRVIDNFLEQVFVHGLFHADLHPANLMMLPDGGVGYLDLGIVGELPLLARQRLVTMTASYARGDLATMSDALLDLSVVPDDAAAADHRARFLRLGESWYQRQPGAPKLRRTFTAVLLDLLALSRVTGVWPQRPVLKYVRSLMAIDALVGRLAPELDAGAYLEVACRRLLDRHRPSASRHLARSIRHLGSAGRRAVELLDRLTDGRPFSIRLVA